MRETNGNFDSCNSCKRLVPSRSHELHESKFPFASRTNLSVRNFRIFLLMYPGSDFLQESSTLELSPIFIFMTGLLPCQLSESV